MAETPQPVEFAEGDQIELGPDDYLQESADVPGIVAAGASTVSALVAAYSANQVRKNRRDREAPPEPPKIELPSGVERNDDPGAGGR